MLADKMCVMIDLNLLARSYFWFDKPVPYKIDREHEIKITPINVEDSEMFLSWIDIISIDKNSLPNPEYISMSYLEFVLTTLVLSEDKKFAEENSLKMASILKLCLGFDKQVFIHFDARKKPYLQHEDILIDGKHFDEIRRIILYQNIAHYDDNYINPDVRQAIDEVDALKNKDIDIPNLERRMAIITSHCGLSKQDQLKMTYRSHTLLFEEVHGEVDYMSMRTAALIGNMFSKQKNEIEDWIYRKKHNKYEKYFTDVNTYQQSMGGQGHIHSKTISINDVNDYSGFIK